MADHDSRAVTLRRTERGRAAAEAPRLQAEKERTEDLIRVSAEYARSGRHPGRFSQADLKNFVDAVEQGFRDARDERRAEKAIVERRRPTLVPRRSSQTADRTANGTPAAECTPSSELLSRIRAEYREMPDLRLTASQAQRLFGLDAGTCDAVLAVLEDTAFLTRSHSGLFVMAETLS
jgi:hypothetical protein